MQRIVTDRHRQPDRAGLRLFLGAVRDAALEDGHWKLASITLRARHLDPLAVLESIYEPGAAHAYLENPAGETAAAGAEAVLEGRFSGDERFAAVRAFAAEVYAHTVAVGDLDLPGSGPRVFVAFAFAPEGGAGFPGAHAFVPRWQVVAAEGASLATANCRVDPECDLDALTDRIWSAHAKFTAVDYAGVAPSVAPARLGAEEVGGVGAYAAAVGEALRRIRAGRYEKIVLARARDLHFAAPLHPLATLDGLRRRFPACHVLSFAPGHGPSFIAATPERLLRVEGGWLQTEAIAGSAPRGAATAEDARLARALLESEKDRREHQIVIDSIRRRLFSVGLVTEPEGEPRLLRLPNIQHLRTPLRAPLGETCDLFAAAAALHPTPAVGGTPRDAALADIPALEAFARGPYAGALGWCDHRGAGELVVGLRAGLIEGARIRLFAGAGIVEGSDPAREQQETEVKMRALEEAL